MLQQQVHIINTFLMILDGFCVILAGYLAFGVKSYLSGGVWSMDSNVFAVSVLLIMFMNNYTMGKFQLYSDKRMSSYFTLAWSILQAIAISFLVLSAGIALLRQIHYSRLFIVLFAGFSFLLVLIFRVLSQLYISSVSGDSFNVGRILIVGDMERGKFVSDLLASQLSWGHKIVGKLSTNKEENASQDSLGSIEDLPRVLRDYAIDEVVFAMDADRSIDLSRYLDICKKTGIPARILPALWEKGTQGLSIERCQDVPFLTIQMDRFNATGLLYKRILDVTGGLFGTLVFFIIFPFIASAIKLDSKGPVLFKQKRVGRHGRSFNLYKFRSMYQDAEQQKQGLLEQNEMNGPMFKLQDDPRITRVGKWLRKTSLDELPQFLNVIEGKMSLVGTRPPTPEEVETYQLWHLKRISAKPGITGLWQVSGRNKIKDFDKVVELDSKYLDNWRFSDDLKILFKTIFVVLQRKGAV